MAATISNVLVLSAAASAVNYIAVLGADPSIRLHVTDADRYCPGLYDPKVTPASLPRARDKARYRAALDQLLAERHIDVLIPTSDYDVEAVVDYLNDGWSPQVHLFRPTRRSHRDLSHKERLMRRVGAVMPTIVPQSWSAGQDVNTAGPVVVKPVAESGGKGISIVPRLEDLLPALARARLLYGDGYVVQQFIPGRTYVVTIVYDHAGIPVVSLPMRSHLTFFTWGGGGCAGELVDSPELVRLSHAVIEACGGWRGPINFEWREHSDTGLFYLMEANCRLNGYSYLTTMNGVSLPNVVLALLLRRPLPPLTLPPPAKRRNFVIGYRESAVTGWVEAADGTI